MDPSEGSASNASNASNPPELAVRNEDTLGPIITIPPPPGGEPPERLSRLSLVGARLSRFSLVPLFNPRWRPWTPARVIRATVSFAAIAALLVVLTHRITRRWAASSPFVAPAAAEAEGVVARPAPVAPRADATLARAFRSPIAGGLLAIPPAFESKDGAYDLVIHFHGNTDLVEESFFISKLDAVVVILNLGNGSGAYEDRFANPGALPEMIDRAQTTLEKRGLAHARLRRLALTAWSAGYGAVLKVLEQPALARRVDAVILLDGIHVGYQPGAHDLILERLAPFERFAREAVRGEKLFSITHSNITPIGSYAGTHETTNALLRQVGVERSPGGDAPPMPVLHSIEGVIAKKRILPLVPETVARQGGLVVRGYTGDQAEDHIAHIVHMSVTALPDLIARWSESGR